MIIDKEILENLLEAHYDERPGWAFDFAEDIQQITLEMVVLEIRNHHTGPYAYRICERIQNLINGFREPKRWRPQSITLREQKRREVKLWQKAGTLAAQRKARDRKK